MELTVDTRTVKCGKCRGTGVIPGFYHVSEGVCFDCRGAGVLVEKKQGTVKYSRAFINEYRQRGYCSSVDADTKKLICIESEGHVTAEKWVMKKGDSYIIGQPVCHASGWYIIPAAHMPEFMKHYNKVHGTSIKLF